MSEITGVQVRLMGEDDAAVRDAAALIEAASGGRIQFSGFAPCRRGPGLRAYGAFVVVPSGGASLKSRTHYGNGSSAGGDASISFMSRGSLPRTPRG